MEERKERRGGRRPGAGRPKGDSRLFSFRCSGELADKMDSLENRTEFIRGSLYRTMREREAAVHEASVLPSFGAVTRAEAVLPVSLPYYDQRVTAGFPVPLDNDEKSQDINILHMLCPHPESSYLIRVKGDSMVDAGIMSGDIVIVDKSRRDPDPKEIAVCEINGEYTLKHFVMEDGAAWLVPANPDYRRRKVCDGDEFSIWGTVTYIIHRARD